MCIVEMANDMVFAMELTKGEIVDARASFVKSIGKSVEEAPTVKP